MSREILDDFFVSVAGSESLRGLAVRGDEHWICECSLTEDLADIQVSLFCSNHERSPCLEWVGYCIEVSGRVGVSIKELDCRRNRARPRVDVGMEIDEMTHDIRLLRLHGDKDGILLFNGGTTRDI